MRKENFYTGEVIQDTSPPISENYISEAEAIQNASFGKYDYDPGVRLMSQPVSIYPGGYGYNNQSQYYPYYSNINYGLGANPYQYNYGYQNYNPALSYIQQNQFQQPQQISYFVNPVNFSGEYMPDINFEDEIERLKLEYWEKEQEIVAQESVNRFNSGYGSPFLGNNYYGVPYYNPFQYNSINSEISQKINEIQNKARETRLNFNLNIAQLAHNYIGDQYDYKELEERYTGKSIDAPQIFQMSMPEIYNYNRFQNLVPFDNKQMYIEKDLAASREYNSVIPANSDMQSCFENMGIVAANYDLDEEKHRRRNCAVLYNSDDNTYKYFVRRKAAERYAAKNGTPVDINYVNNSAEIYKQGLITNYPTLQQSAKLCEDGTLNITCNFGSKAGQVYSVHNSQEAGYEKDRERFQSFLNSIPGSIYLNNTKGGDN